MARHTVTRAVSQPTGRPEHPGYAETPLAVQRFADPAERQQLLDRTPMGRLGKAEDIAIGMLFLTSDESSWVTGSERVIDGGMTAR